MGGLGESHKDGQGRYLIHEVKEGKYKGKYKKPEKDEIGAALKAEKRRKILLKKINDAEKEIHKISEGCTHPVCYDEPGYVYHTRICITCGHTSDL